MDPQPSSDQLERYYTNGYRVEYEFPPAAQRFESDLPEAVARVGRMTSVLTDTVRLLEVGSGSGAFLASVAPFVEMIRGVEPDVEMRRFIERELGIDVHASVEDAIATQGTGVFDLVVGFHVLEHVPRPVEFLQTLGRLIHPRRGRIIVEVPNVDDALVSVYQIPAYRTFYYQIAHLHYFSALTLARTLELAGFSAAIQPIQRYDISNHTHWLRTGQPGGQGKYSSILNASVNDSYAQALVQAGVSDTLLGVAGISGRSMGV
ncbi:MAG: class I SAM-dependent methyltransferase [Actinomycetota bacterium]|nr:class I SAM-dependent methyltransferase [Actinomycetota bacterium]